MPILPIDSGRYGTPEMLKIFDEESRLQKILQVEAALAYACSKVGEIPIEAAEEISKKASTKYVSLDRVKEIEKQVKHEMAAIVIALSEVCGKSGAYVHLGATSNDILDTALALQMKDALNLIEKRLFTLEETLMNLAEKYKEVIMIGRTHGQHALPITLGFKFAIWMREISRHITRLFECKQRLLVGKMSGAVGTGAGFSPHAAEIQKIVMEKLGLKQSDITSQIIGRDIHAELLALFSIISASIEKFALEIRELQRPEIAEVSEPFEERQVGSSTMPHKKNPIICERICGLSRILRSLVYPALENIVTWHERDLCQSSVERFIIPQSFILLDYILERINFVLSNLRINVNKMQANVELTKGRILSEAVMIKLIKRGMDRKEAYELIQRLCLESEEKGCTFKDVLLKSSTILKLLSEEEIDELLDVRKYLGNAIQQIEDSIKVTKEERRKRLNLTCSH